MGTDHQDRSISAQPSRGHVQYCALIGELLEVCVEFPMKIQGWFIPVVGRGGIFGHGSGDEDPRYCGTWVASVKFHLESPVDYQRLSWCEGQESLVEPQPRGAITVCLVMAGGE